MPGRKPGFAGEFQAAVRSVFVWGVGAQWVHAYGCTSNAPASHRQRTPLLQRPAGLVEAVGHGDSTPDRKTYENTRGYADRDANPLSTAYSVFRDFPWPPQYKSHSRKAYLKPQPRPFG